MRAPKMTRALMFLAAALFAGSFNGAVASAGEAQNLVDKAELTVNAFRLIPIWARCDP